MKLQLISGLCSANTVKEDQHTHPGLALGLQPAAGAQCSPLFHHAGNLHPEPVAAPAATLLLFVLVLREEGGGPPGLMCSVVGWCTCMRTPTRVVGKFLLLLLHYQVMPRHQNIYSGIDLILTGRFEMALKNSSLNYDICAL